MIAKVYVGYEQKRKLIKVGQNFKELLHNIS